MMNPIDEFRGPTRWLSNFEYAEVTIDGKTYKTNEHYFQACKAITEAEHEAIRLVSSPKEAKHMGRQVACRSDWEGVKDAVMLKGLRAKFAVGSDLAVRLLATEDRPLIEGNPYGDRYWGAVRKGNQWVGKNRLGKLLMQVRQELRIKS